MNLHAELRCLEISEAENKFVPEIKTRQIETLPAGEVLIKVEYSSLNYKDVLSARGNRGITKVYPHVPGIDAAGSVVSSTVPQWQAGDQVIVTGFDLGMNTSGGFSTYIRVPANWITRLPKTLSLKESMIYGTAGFTAALSVNELIKNGIRPEDGKVLVTGASGGVGSVAVAILAHLGYNVNAVSSKSAARDFLLSMGASENIARDEFDQSSAKALMKPSFRAAIDTVGGVMLANVIKSLSYQGVVTCCGMVNGGDLPITVYPFILRGIRLIGIDSVEFPIADRAEIWNNLATKWRSEKLEDLGTEITLNQLAEAIDNMESARSMGRTIIKLAQ